MSLPYVIQKKASELCVGDRLMERLPSDNGPVWCHISTVVGLTYHTDGEIDVRLQSVYGRASNGILTATRIDVFDVEVIV